MEKAKEKKFKLRRLTNAMRLLRANLRSRPANGTVAFVPYIRKLVFEYCDKWPSSDNTRTYILNYVETLAKQNPHVEVVIKQRNQKEPIVRGFYGLLSHYPALILSPTLL